MVINYTINVKDNDNKWLESFNSEMGHNLEVGQLLGPVDVHYLTEKINIFNKEKGFSNDPVIFIKENVEK